jgi:hypothetical protein
MPKMMAAVKLKKLTNCGKRPQNAELSVAILTFFEKN